jgi:hypothetical protein
MHCIEHVLFLYGMSFVCFCMSFAQYVFCTSVGLGPCEVSLLYASLHILPVQLHLHITNSARFTSHFHCYRFALRLCHSEYEPCPQNGMTISARAMWGTWPQSRPLNTHASIQSTNMAHMSKPLFSSPRPEQGCPNPCPMPPWTNILIY